MAATMNYTEAQLGHNAGGNTLMTTDTVDNNYNTDDGDGVSTTLTFQTGISSGYQRNSLSLSRLSRHSIKVKTSSSFPNLLSLYQAPIREESTLEKLEKKPKRPKRERKQKVSNKNDSEEHHERRTRQEQRHIRVDAVVREQLDKFDVYVKTMRQKVEKQREERQKYNEVLQERLRAQEEEEKRKLRLHRGPRHTYVHDTNYLKTLPVSKYCKTIRLADDLQRKGVLRTRGDVEKFWSGYASRQRQGVDIFASDNASSVNYPAQWMSIRNPEIKVKDDDPDDSWPANDTHVQPHKQLPPLKKRKKKNATLQTL